MEENARADWFEHYLALIRAELNVPEVKELLSIRNSALKRRDSLENEIIKIENEIASLKSSQDKTINEALDLERKTSKVNKIKEIEGEIKSIELYREKLDYKGQGVGQELDLAEKNLGVAIKRALRKARAQEQGLLNQELEIIAKRIREFKKAGQQASNEIKGKIDFYFLGSASDINVNCLLKELKI